jgi:hypothetical protein
MRYHIYGIGAALVDTEIDVSDQDLAQLDITKGHMTLVDAEKQQAIMAYLAEHTIHKQTQRWQCGQLGDRRQLFWSPRKLFIPAKWPMTTTAIFIINDMQAAGVACNGIEPSRQR